MTTSGLLELLRRQWAVVLLCALLGAALGAGAAIFVLPASYSATVKLYVSGVGKTASDRLQSGEYARTRVSSYADMVNSTDVLDAVRADLGLLPRGDGSLAGLATSIEATNPLDTSVIDVTVHAGSPSQAQAVAAALGSVYGSVVDRLESPPDGKDSPVRITVASPPALPGQKDGPSAKLYGAAGLAGGAVLGVAAAAVLELTRSGLRSRRSAPPTSAGSWSWWPRQPQGTAARAEAKEVA